MRPRELGALILPSLLRWKTHDSSILRYAQSGRVLAEAFQHMSKARKSALIAEDDAALRRMMVTILRPLDLNVDEARDGLEAVQFLRERRYDVVIVDLMMPRLDGYTVIRFLEEEQPHARAIVTSAVSGMDLGGIARAKVVRAVLSKPFDISVFLNRVRDCLTTPLRKPSASARADDSGVRAAIHR
jgi:CheY-like chemotaxis protein